MGMYAGNNFNLTIPVAAITAIMDEYDAKDWQGNQIPRTPEGIARLVMDEYGSEEYGIEADPDFTIEDDAVVIRSYSYGRVGDSDKLGAILARHGATGIVWGEADTYLFLDEYKDGTVTQHSGVVMFPSYKGTLYTP